LQTNADEADKKLTQKTEAETKAKDEVKKLTREKVICHHQCLLRYRGIWDGVVTHSVEHPIRDQ